MSNLLNHRTVATGPDNPLSQVSKTQWNDDHVQGDEGVLGRAAGSGGGATQILQASDIITLLGLGALSLLNTVGASQIDDAAVSLAKMANLAQDQFIGRVTASTGVPETATITAAARSVLDDTTVSAMVDTLGGAAATGTGGLVRKTSASLITPTILDGSSNTLLNYDAAYTGDGKGARPVFLLTNVGLVGSYTNTSTITPIINYVYTVSPAVDQVGLNSNTWAKGSLLSTGAKAISGMTFLDAVAFHGGTVTCGYVSCLSATFGATSSGTVTNAVGCSSILRATSATTAPNFGNVYHFTTAGDGTALSAAITGNWYGHYYTSMNMTGGGNSVTVGGNRAAIFIDTMSGTPSGTDYAIESRAAQPSLFLGPIAAGLAGTANGFVTISGSTSGVVTIRGAGNAAGTWTFRLPSSGGTNKYPLTTDGSGISTWALLDLTAAVTGALPVANGGTNATTAAAARTSLGTSYPINIKGLTSGSGFNPADATTYFFGMDFNSTTTTGGVQRVYIKKAGTIVGVDCHIQTGGTLGTNETSTVAIGVNNSSFTNVDTGVKNDALSYFSQNTCSIAVAAGDYIEVRWTTPTWSTNPTVVYPSFTVWVE